MKLVFFCEYSGFIECARMYFPRGKEGEPENMPTNILLNILRIF
jgi:hypothetical protein